MVNEALCARVTRASTSGFNTLRTIFLLLATICCETIASTYGRAA